MLLKNVVKWEHFILLILLQFLPSSLSTFLLFFMCAEHIPSVQITKHFSWWKLIFTTEYESNPLIENLVAAGRMTLPISWISFSIFQVNLLPLILVWLRECLHCIYPDVHWVNNHDKTCNAYMSGWNLELILLLATDGLLDDQLFG